MKIFFDGVNWLAEHTGPSSFAKRLAIQLGNMGHQIADPDDYDVALVFIEPTDKLNKAKPYVQRLDGFWFSPQQVSSGMNDGIRRCYESATDVVWQSEFDMKMSLKHFGVRSGHVVRNGVELRKAAVRSEQLIEMRAQYDKIFVSSAHWHPQKRLRDNVEVFRRMRDTQCKNSCLIVLGNNPDYQVADKGIFYAGSIRQDLCAEVYASADWMIHTAYLDHCPNTVVEAISQGCPVLCSSDGGTSELANLAAGNGIVIESRSPYDFSLVDYEDPPRISLEDVPMLPQFRAQPWTVDIVETAKAYAGVLESALNASR